MPIDGDEVGLFMGMEGLFMGIDEFFTRLPQLENLTVGL